MTTTNREIRESNRIGTIKPAVIFKFAKLPIASESEEVREEKEKVFPTPEDDPDRDLSWSKLFMLGNPSFCISNLKA